MNIGELVQVPAEEAAGIVKSLAFDAGEYAWRLDRVQSVMSEQGLDGLVLHSPENLCYLSGFHTPGYYFPQALIVAASGTPRLVTRYLEQPGALAASWLDPENLVGYLDHQEPVGAFLATLDAMGLNRGRIGIEKQGYSTLPIRSFEQLEAGLADAELVDASGLVEQFRAIKSPAEIAYIRRAAEISSLAMMSAMEHCKADMTEHALAAQVSKTLVANGAEYAGLPIFIASGHRTYIRHAVPSEKIIERGDNVLVELTGVVRRYAGPLFRTLNLGPPSATMRAHSDAARDMLDALIEGLKPGLTSHEANAMAVEAAGKSGAGAVKRAGYSVGLNFPPDWGEGVFLDLCTGNQTILEAGMVFHMPQTIRVGANAPSAISETVLMTEDGCEVLTKHTPRDLVVVD